MEKISFINWLEVQGPTVASPAPNNPALAPTVLNQQGDTVSNPQNQPVGGTPDNDVIQSTTTLQQIQSQLTDIFKKVMEKPIWRNQQMKAAFGDRINKSWEKAGQAKAILAPIASGDIDDI